MDLKTLVKIEIEIYTYLDTRPDDSHVDPVTDEVQTTVGCVLTREQVVFLKRWIDQKRIKPIKIQINVRRIYHEFRKPHYRAVVYIGCYDEHNNYHRLKTKRSQAYSGYVAFAQSANWIP